MLKMTKLDWNSIKYYHVNLIMIPICLLLIGWGSTIYLVPMGVFLSFLFSVNTFFIEEKGNLYRFYLTLPVKRSHMVLGRHLLSFILSAMGVLWGLALMPLANLYSFSKWYPDFKWSLALISVGFLCHALLSLFMYPLLFRLGYQKGKLWGFYIPAILMGLIYLLILEYDLYAGGLFIHDLLIYASGHLLRVVGMIAGLGAAALTLSCLLSVKLYSRREF